MISKFKVLLAALRTQADGRERTHGREWAEGWRAATNFVEGRLERIEQSPNQNTIAPVAEVVNTYREGREAIDVLREDWERKLAAEAGRVPEGWTLVPKAATGKMLAEARSRGRGLEECWAIMLAAAPRPPSVSAAPAPDPKPADEGKGEAREVPGNPHHDYLRRFWQDGFDGKIMAACTGDAPLIAYHEGREARACYAAHHSPEPPPAEPAIAGDSLYELIEDLAPECGGELGGDSEAGWWFSSESLHAFATRLLAAHPSPHAAAQPATAKPARDAEFKVGDRVIWSSDGGTKFPGTVASQNAHGAYHVDLDDGTSVHIAPASSLTRLTGGSHD